VIDASPTLDALLPFSIVEPEFIEDELESDAENEAQSDESENHLRNLEDEFNQQEFSNTYINKPQTRH
jgi:hypothetical protein